ncbi:MAG: KH domain-containing protein [Janthinobacterium lividum]
MTEHHGSAASSTQQLCDLVTGLARLLADEPAQVRVEPETIDDSLVLRLSVSEPDLAKLIGKQGRTARSFRTVVGAASNQLETRCSVDIQAEA